MDEIITIFVVASMVAVLLVVALIAIEMAIARRNDMLPDPDLSQKLRNIDNMETLE